MAYYVGLDVHSKACTFVIQGPDRSVGIPQTRSRGS